MELVELASRNISFFSPINLASLTAFEKWATRLHSLLWLFLFFFFLITYFSNFIIFNWRIITLQYCDDFCHTSIWISHNHTHVPSLLNIPPHPDPLGYINMYAWSRERWHWQSYLQGSKRCKHREWTLGTVKEAEGGMAWERSTETHTFISVQSLSCVQLFVTPWTAACQTSLSITNSGSLLKLMSIESMIPSNHLILCCPLLLQPSIFSSIRIFSNESPLHMRWPKYWSFSFSTSPSNEHPGLMSFRMDWLDLLAVQGTLKSLLQHHSSKASMFQHSAFFTVQL